MTFLRPSISVQLPALVLVALAGRAPAAGQEPELPGVPRTAEVTVITGAINVDGVLDEEAWRLSPPIGELIQRQPVPGATPSEETEVTLLRDRDNLYIGVVAHDSEPGSVLGSQLARDGNLNSDDRIEILLDTFRDQRNAFYFATNPAGALVDGLTYANGELNTDWDTTWDVGTRRTETGWTAEFMIPFKSLSFPDEGRVWGFNLSRQIYRRLEDVRWSGARLETQFLQVSEAGEIGTFEGLNQGIGVEVRPFVSGNALRIDGAGTTDMSAEPGLDVAYRITPSLRMIGTVNTDFGETEVDLRQINLNRFSLFFPEKRAFFLEDAGVFSFAGTGPGTPGGVPGTGADVYPFFSRRVGLLEGQEVPIRAGGKLAGRVGRAELGVLGVRMGEVDDLAEATDLLVGRVKWDLLDQSYAGLIVTSGDPTASGTSQTYGADVRLATSSFLGGSRNLDVNAYAARSVHEGITERDWSYGVSARYPNDRYDAQVAFKEVQSNFDPSLGFVQRPGVRMFRIAASFNPRPADFLGVQQMFHDIFYTRFTNLESGEVESWDVHVTPFDWHFSSGDNIHSLLDYRPTYERLFEPFQISPGVVLPTGQYRFTRFRAFANTANRRRLSGGVGFGWGSYWSGHAEDLMTSLTFRVPPTLSVALNANLTFARLPEGDFTARIFSMNSSLSISPALSFFNLVQYDNRSMNLGWQSRLRWTLRPGSDLFVSFQRGWIRRDEPGSRVFRPGDSRGSVKLQYSVFF